MDSFCIQMTKYHPNDQGILNAGNDAYITTAFTTGFYVYIKHTFQALCPGHCSMTLGCLGFSAFAPFRGCHYCPIATIGCKYSMETSEVDSGFGNQSNRKGNGDLLGAWCIDQRSQQLSPVFSAFIPNSLYAESWMAKLVLQLGMRARNCEHWWFPDTEFTKTTMEVVLGRKGEVSEGSETPH
jgi:hypothetical protein